MKYSFNFCHGSRTVGFSASTIVVEVRPAARLLCRYVRPLVVAHGESSSSLAVELGLAASEQIEMILVWLSGNAYVEVFRPRGAFAHASHWVAMSWGVCCRYSDDQRFN